MSGLRVQYDMGNITMDKSNNMGNITMDKSNIVVINKHIKELENHGVMCIGDYSGMSIDEAKDRIVEDMIRDGTAMIYYEPDKKVISRSGDKCVVALTDQWFIDYGDADLTVAINDYIMHTLVTHNEKVRLNFLATSNWLDQWPCSRQYGLGTRLLDTPYVIDSLSDSTIYMAYYTVAHLINRIPIDELDGDVWNYIFLNKTMPERYNTLRNDTGNTLNLMKQEFKYW